MPAPSFLKTAANYCAKLTQKSQSNFYYAFLFLPRERREALEAVYAYCRLVDDVVDEEATVEAKLAGIEKWRRELELVYGAGEITHPVSAKLRQAVRRFGIRREDMEAVIDGCAMDVDKTRYANWDELRLYCYRVASAVGLMCIQIFGYPPGEIERVREYAIDLGIALQLTNIIRDVAEDARRGRIYLPEEDLRAFGVRADELTAPDRGGEPPPEHIHRLLRYQAARARAHYLRARAALNGEARRQLVIAEIMGDIYYALLGRLEAEQFAIFGPRVTVRRRDKMAIALYDFARAKIGAFVGA
jgi:phytoene synthase